MELGFFFSNLYNFSTTFKADSRIRNFHIHTITHASAHIYTHTHTYTLAINASNRVVYTSKGILTRNIRRTYLYIVSYLRLGIRLKREMMFAFRKIAYYARSSPIYFILFPPILYAHCERIRYFIRRAFRRN